MNDLFNTTLTLGHHTLTVLELMEALLVFLVARIFLAVVRRGLRRAQRLSRMDEGKQFIVRRLVTSVVWALAAMVALRFSLRHVDWGRCCGSVWAAVTAVFTPRTTK